MLVFVRAGPSAFDSGCEWAEMTADPRALNEAELMAGLSGI